MSRRASLLLRAFAIFTTWVWVVMMRDAIVGQHLSASFRLIHVGIGIVSLAYAGVTWRLTGVARRFTRTVERERRPQVERKSVAHRAGASFGRRARAATPATLPDSSLPDSSMPDSPVSDSSMPDSSMPESSTPDSSLPDSSLPDSSLPDSSLPDSSLPDSSLPYGPMSDSSMPEVSMPVSTPVSGSLPLDDSPG